MNNKYRVDWKSGMRLTDETFRTADNFYISCLEPLYSVLVNGDYGFLDLPIFRYELTDTYLSVHELEANAISASGKLIQISFTREERNLFQHIKLPDTTESLILFIDKSSDKTVSINGGESLVPLCDADYRLLVKLENEHYNNPDAVPLARLTCNHGWNVDASFIAPCIALRANSSLLRLAIDYAVELRALSKVFKEAAQTDKYILVMSILPALNRVIMELEKESDSMKPRHLITLMQEIIQLFLTLSEVDDTIQIPERERCVFFVESYYTPYSLSDMIDEGIYLTRLMLEIPQTFGRVEPEEEIVERPYRPQRRVSTDSIRKKHH